jgi:hypothetical protein
MVLTLLPFFAVWSMVDTVGFGAVGFDCGLGGGRFLFNSFGCDLDRLGLC